MKILKKATALLMTTVMTLTITACGGKDNTAKHFNAEREVTVTVWYSDESYTSYLSHVAEQFHKANEFVSIEPVYKSEDGFLEEIYNQSIYGDEAPDVYLMSGKDMQKAYLSGIMAENDVYTSYYSDKNYPVTAINAACYEERLYGYPITFDTSFMVYNKKVVSPVENFEQLEEFAAQFQLTEETKKVSLVAAWDTKNLNLNYAFAGSYMNPGGISAEDSSDNGIASQEALLSALQAYAGLKTNFEYPFALDEKECVNRFKNGTLLYTITTAKYLKELNSSDIEYGICEIPAAKAGYGTESLSDTTMAMVNPHSESVAAAKAVAQALSYDYADLLEPYTGYISARHDVRNKNHSEEYAKLYEIYSKSDIWAKYMGSQTFYLKLNNLLADTWAGKDVNEAWQKFNSPL